MWRAHSVWRASLESRASRNLFTCHIWTHSHIPSLSMSREDPSTWDPRLVVHHCSHWVSELRFHVPLSSQTCSSCLRKRNQGCRRDKEPVPMLMPKKCNQAKCKYINKPKAKPRIQLLYTRQHGTVLIIFPLNPQTSIVAQLLSAGSNGEFLYIVNICNILPSVLWCCWLGSKKGIRSVKNWVVGCCVGWGADLQMARLMPLPLTISCSSKSRLVLPFWFYFSGTWEL